MRLLPFTFALALIAIRPVGGPGGALACRGGADFPRHPPCGNDGQLRAYDRPRYRSELQALQHVPRGASVLSLVVRPCGNEWSTERLDHLPARWRSSGAMPSPTISGTVDSAQALTVISWGSAPSRATLATRLSERLPGRSKAPDLNRAIATFNRAAFDHVWVLNGAVAAADLQPICSKPGHSRSLYRVRR